MEIITNNLANTDTPGFKADYLSLNLVKPPAGLSAGSVRQDDFGPMIRFYTDFSAGELRATGNHLDFALEGDGFFAVETPQGVQYTRKGNFAVNKDGTLVTQEGLPVLGDAGPIQIEGDDIRCDQEGNLYAGDEQAAKLRIVRIEDKTKLEKSGESLFRLKDGGAVAPAEGTFVRQGFLEGSNVTVIRAMTEMIEALRGYEAYQKMMQTIDENTSKSVNEVGRIS
jgi:flagellar basal-body rod protein FlgG